MKSRILGLILVIMLALTGCYGQGVEMGLAGVEPVIPDTRDEEVAMIIRGEETLMFTSLADAVAAVKNGETIQLIADTEEGTISYDGGTFIIDLNGKIARIAGFSLSGNMNLTLRDEKEYKGKLRLASTGPVSGIAPDTDRQVKLTVAGANIESEGLLLYSRGNGSSVTVLGGKITCAGAMQNDNTGCGAISGSGVTEVTISGGTFTVGQGQAVRLEKDKGKVTISGGYINAALEVIRAAKQAEISGGTLVGHGTVSDSAKGSEELHGTDIATVSITGGYFGHDQSGRTDWLGSFVCIEDSGDGDGHEDSAYAIKAAVARYADTNYVSLAKALEAAGSSEDSEVVVTLLANAEQTGLPYKLVSGKTLVIKLNGHSDPQLNVTPADGSPAGSEVSRTEDSGSIIYRSAVAYMVLYDLNGAPEASGTQYGYPHLFEGTKTP
ncbi:MAG: hypothetical protein IJI05_02415, partial [Erysipelotrichaceae bacterium]|nr:hypothetical protein [Erysipelotrichaceae bacterium]